MRAGHRGSREIVIAPARGGKKSLHKKCRVKKPRGAKAKIGRGQNQANRIDVLCGQTSGLEKEQKRGAQLDRGKEPKCRHDEPEKKWAGD